MFYASESMPVKQVLFITWDSPHVSYLEALFLPIFRSLQSCGYNFHILQFSWADSSIKAARHQACEENGISYSAVPVFRKPQALGAVASSILGSRHIARLIDEKNIDIVMPRSTLPAMSSLLALRGRNKKLIFDADGLPLDERIDFAGLSPSSLVYRFLRDVEAQAVRSSDVVITRSERANSILQARAGAGNEEKKFHVVTNGRDVNKFHPASQREWIYTKKKLGISDEAPLVVYAGSIGPQYCPEIMLELFSKIKISRSDSHFLILTGSPEVMNTYLVKYPEISDSVTVMSADSEDVPKWLSAGDLGLAFREPKFSMQAVAPIKLGEYLLCGLPVVATTGVGDSHFISSDAGFLVDHGDVETIGLVSDWFVNKVLPNRNEFRAQCVAVGRKHFSLESSVESYVSALSVS
jgi:glycosyltransferase involved in cell wall biosynthesis